MIPSMYLFLVIYSIFNLNVVSWGTREDPKTDEEKPPEAAKKKESKSKKSFLGSLFRKDNISLDFVKNFFKSQVRFFQKRFHFLFICVKE